MCKGKKYKIEDIKQRCVELANKSTFRTHHGSVISYKCYIIGSGYNLNLHSNFAEHFNELKTLHAEMIAVMRVKNKKLLENATLYVTRISKKTGKLTYSRPCIVCRSMMNSFHIHNICYTDYNGNWISERI